MVENIQCVGGPLDGRVIPECSGIGAHYTTVANGEYREHTYRYAIRRGDIMYLRYIGYMRLDYDTCEELGFVKLNH